MTMRRADPLVGARVWIIRIAAIASVLAWIAVVLVDTALGWPVGWHQAYATLSNMAVAFSYIGVGWVIAERHPSNAVGPVLVSVGVLYTLFQLGDLYLALPGTLPADGHAALFVTVIPYLVRIFLAFAVILFPDGRPPSPRWRWVMVAGSVLVGLAVVGLTFGSGTFAPIYPDIGSPFGIATVPRPILLTIGDVGGPALMLAGAVALVVRWRRGDRVVRTQITWVVVAGLVMVATIINLQTHRENYDWEADLAYLLANIGSILVPLAMGIAITRYHLYDIDRIVSRTISYAVVTAVLFAVFALLILVLQSAISGAVARPGGPIDPAVAAASTLLVVALFSPLRRRVQSAVDRRFHRARYDAERTAEGFAGRLRDSLDLPTLTGELRRAALAAVEPTTSAIWIRPLGKTADTEGLRPAGSGSSSR
jgi:hypothetical protein